MTTTSPATGSTKISQLGAAAALGGTEVFPGTQSGVTKAVTAAQIAAYVNSVNSTLNVVASPYNADPSGATDSSAAFTAAHTAAVALGYAGIYVPAGTYLINSTQLISPYVSWWTDAVVVIKTTNTVNASLFTVSSRYGNAPNFTMPVIFEGKFRFQQVGTGTGACLLLGDGVGGSGYGCAANVVARGVEFYNFHYLVQFQNQAYINAFEDCYFNGGSFALFSASSQQNIGERTVFNHCVFSGNVTLASLNTSMELFFSNCSIDYNNAFGSNLTGSDLFLDGCHFEWSNTSNTLFGLSSPSVGGSAHWANCVFNMTAAANSGSLPSPMIADIGTSTFVDVINCAYRIPNAQTQNIVLFNISAATGKFNGPANYYSNGTSITTYVNNTGSGTLHTF